MTVAMPFKVTISSIDTGLKVEAQFNPKDLQVDKNVTWNKKPDPKQNLPGLEYTGADARTMSLELLFDEAETGNSVQDKVSVLLTLASTIGDPTASGTPEDKKRPHKVAVIWGDSRKIPEFKGVIASVTTKYTMFKADGTPVRATCNVKFTEADVVSFKAPKEQGGAA